MKKFHLKEGQGGADILDDLSAKRLWMNYTRRGWRRGEPFDGKMEEERPHLIRYSFELLISERVQSVHDICDALPFPKDDLEEIADLDPGTLGGSVPEKAEPVLKPIIKAAAGNRPLRLPSLRRPSRLGSLFLRLTLFQERGPEKKRQGALAAAVAYRRHPNPQARRV